MLIYAYKENSVCDRSASRPRQVGQYPTHTTTAGRGMSRINGGIEGMAAFYNDVGDIGERKFEDSRKQGVEDLPGSCAYTRGHRSLGQIIIVKVWPTDIPGH